MFLRNFVFFESQIGDFTRKKKLFPGIYYNATKAKINLFAIFLHKLLKCEAQNMDGIIAAAKNVDGRYRDIKRERVERNRQTQRNFPILISSGVILKGKPTTKLGNQKPLSPCMSSYDLCFMNDSVYFVSDHY